MKSQTAHIRWWKLLLPLGMQVNVESGYLDPKIGKAIIQVTIDFLRSATILTWLPDKVCVYAVHHTSTLGVASCIITQ